MTAAALVRHSDPKSSFEFRELPLPETDDGQVRIRVEAFGLNFADVMARQGNYPDCPDLPAVIGYDVVGTIDALGDGVDGLSVGDRVTAMTRFGGYAEYAVTDHRACAPIGDMDAGKALALTTQYCTAWYCIHEMVNLYPGDRVLIHAAAGGVGTALVQMARDLDLEIFGTAGSDAKLDYLRDQGVHHPINYRSTDYEEVVSDIVGDTGLDTIFDPVGGDYVRKDIRLLGAGGRLVLFGASDMTGANIFQKIRSGIGFGIYHPAQFMAASQALIGVNMLRIADHRPEVLKRCLENVVRQTRDGTLNPTVARIFPASELAEAHAYLEGRKSMGKIGLTW